MCLSSTLNSIIMQDKQDSGSIWIKWKYIKYIE
jgi:hypothetical protein